MQQQRRGITNKQKTTTTSSQKPELPASEPPYEVIEFPAQQQYSNTITLKHVQKSGTEKKVERKCDLCGSSNAQFFCDVCVQQTFCASCDQMYHRHPKRQRHTRKRIQQTVQKGMEPPLPPKNEMNQAPVPPPRRNKRNTRVGTPNANNQGTIKKNGSLMGSLKRFMGGIQSNTPQSTLGRNTAKSPNLIPHSSSATDSDRQSGGRNFGYLDWNPNSRHRSDSFTAFNGPFPSLMQAQSMAQLNCPSCHHQGRSSWDWNRSRDWNRSQMNLNALPPWTAGLAAGNPWHGSIIIPPPYPMIPNDEFVRRDSFHSQRSGRHRRPPKFRLEDDDSDLSASDDRQSVRKTKSPHLLRTASPALSRRSRRTVASESEEDERSASRRSDPRSKRRIVPTSRDCSPAPSRRGFRKKHTEDDDTMSMKSVGSRRSVKSSRSYLRKTRHHTSSDSDDELTSDKDADVQMDFQTSPLPQCQSPLKNAPKMNSPTEKKQSEKLEDWECEHCTYLNSRESKVCDVCCKSRTRPKSPSSAKNEDVQLESSMKNMRISVKNASDTKMKGNEKPEEKTIKSISTGTSPPPQTTSTQTYDIPQYSGKRNRSLSCEDYSEWNPAKKTNSILSSSSGKQSSSFQPDSSQSSEYIHSLLQNHVKHGAEIVKLLKDAELHHFELEDVTAALTQCGDENPIKWLTENWNKMIDTVVTLATNYGREQVENTIGTISSIEAQAALRLHNGDIWAAVTECIRQRQTKYTRLMSRGLYSREDVVTVLTANHGNLEAAYKELSKSQMKPFLMKIWGPPQGLDNDSGDISKLHYKDHEYETDGGSAELPNDHKQDFNRIQSWLDTASTSASEFDEYLHFEEALTHLRKQSNSNNYNKFSPHSWEQRAPNLGVFQNEKFNRYNSCDNLKMTFDNILKRKKIYASTDVLSAPKVENRNHKLPVNHSEMEKDIKDRMKLNFNNIRQSHELEQFLIMNKNSKRNAIIENDNRNETNMEYSLENYIKNYLNDGFAHQDIPQYTCSTRGHVSPAHSTQDQVTKAHSIQKQLADHKIDLNDGLVESTKFVSEINLKSNSNELETTNTIGYKVTPVDIQPPSDKLVNLEPDQQNSHASISQTNSDCFSVAVKPLEIQLIRTLDLEKNFLVPAEAMTPTENMIKDSVESKNSNSKVIESTTTAGEGLQQTNLETHRKHEKKEKTSENLNEENQKNTENKILKADEILDYFEEKTESLIEKEDELMKSEFTVADEKNKTAIRDEFSVSKQNLDHMTQFEADVSLHPEDFENSNIPNMISKQPSGRSNLSSSKLHPPIELTTAPLCYELITEKENAILLPELNALYWLAKRHLDFHIIEMKDAPLHTSVISKTYINNVLENQQCEISGKMNLENVFNETEMNPKENFKTEVKTTSIENVIRTKTESTAFENGTISTATELQKNEKFLFDQENPEKSMNQNKITKNSISLAEIIIEESVTPLAEKEQVEVTTIQNRSSNYIPNEITTNTENGLIVPNKKIISPTNRNKIASSSIHIILVNEKDTHILSHEESPHTSDQNENPSLTKDINLVTIQNGSLLTGTETVENLANHNKITSNTTDMNSVDQQNGSPLLVEEKIETHSKHNEITTNSGAIITFNEEKECLLSDKEQDANTCRSEISTTREVMIDEEAITLNRQEENIEETEESDISSVTSDSEEEPGNSENENLPKNIQNTIAHKENVTAEEFSPSENENAEERLQISNNQLVFKPPLGDEKEDSDNLNDAIEKIKKPKNNLKNKNVTEISHAHRNQSEERNKNEVDIPFDRTTATENLECQHFETSSNKIKIIQASIEIEKLHQSDSTSTHKLFENSVIILENYGTTDLPAEFDESHLQLQPSTTENAKDKPTERINEENSRNQNKDLYTSSLEAEAKQYLTEGLVSTIDQAELAAQLMQLKFDRSQSIDAANECSNIHSAIVYLQQECHLCAEKFSMKQMISLLECEHKCCQDCARQFFSLQINEKSIEHCVCPFCGEPKLPQLDSDAIFNYFSNLDILLKTILEPQTHELFQQKLRDRTLMQDPCFKWCAKCSFGFIADLDQKRLSCPSCKAVSCANCGKLWTKEHHGKSCEQYNKWLATQNDSNHQFINYLEENGVTCPKCDTKFILVKGGCMHLTCTHCKYEFCSDCLKPFSMGADCKQSDYCAKLGLHAHHPRNCLFYLRDKEPGELKQLLLENNIELNLQKSKEKRCSVQLQRETDDGLIDTKCNALVEEGGLCRTHYIEYLASLIRKNKIDPVTILDLTEILQELRRQGKSLPIRSANSFEHEYRKHCIEMVKEEIPLG